MASGDLTLSVGGGNPVYGTPQEGAGVRRTSPLRESLSGTTTSSTSDTLTSNADTFRLEAPE